MEKWEILSRRKNISWNLHMGNFLNSSKLLSRNFWQISLISTLHGVHSMEITEFYCHHFFAKISWNQLFTNEFYSKLIWRKKNSMAANFSVSHAVLWELRYFTLFIFPLKFCKISWVSTKFTLYLTIFTKYYSSESIFLLFPHHSV